MPKGIERTRRIGEQMRRELAAAVSHVLDHPHASLLSFTEVRVTRDLAFAKVYVTHVLNNPHERAALIDALNARTGQFRHYLAKQMSIRKVPALTFYYDDSIEYGAKMETLLGALVKDLPPPDEDAYSRGDGGAPQS